MEYKVTPMPVPSTKVVQFSFISKQFSRKGTDAPIAVVTMSSNTAQ
jgi:hypothetical protein